MDDLIELEDALQFLHPVKTVLIKFLVLKDEYDDLYYEHKRLKKEPATYQNNRLKKLIKTTLRRKRNEYDIRHPIKKAGDWTKKIQLLNYYLELARRKDLFLTIDRINLQGCDLRSLYFRTTNQDDPIVSFTNSNLSGANLEEADLSFIDLRSSLLVGTHLKGTNLYEANLRGANFFEADLEQADLEGANLYQANLYKANLKDANLENAMLNKYDSDDDL